MSKKVNDSISGISINSKKLKKNNLFLPLKGKNYDAHQYVYEAFKKGASIAIVNKIKSSIKKNKQIKVSDTLEFLTKSSKIVRENFDGRIIAITGSCGKTSLKELLGNTINKYSTATLSLNAHERFSAQGKDYFQLRQTFDHHTAVPKQNIPIIF